MAQESPVGIVLLAAGQSSRFQGVKALAPVEGRPMLQRAIDNYVDLPGTSLTVVVGAHLRAIEGAIDFANARKLVNAEWREGMSSSIRCAIKQAAGETQAALFVAGDQVGVEGAHLMGIIERWRNEPEATIAASYSGLLGIPAIFPRAVWPELVALTGDKGARFILQTHRRTIAFPLPEAKIDIDTREDLAKLR